MLVPIFDFSAELHDALLWLDRDWPGKDSLMATERPVNCRSGGGHM
jgi:hypothetical protein